MINEFDETKKQITTEFDGVIEDSKKIREILSDPSQLSEKDLKFVMARIGNNKTINVALNGKISIIRLTSRTKRG